MADPLYVTQEPFNWTGDLFPAALLGARVTTVGGSNRSIRWDGLDPLDTVMAHNLIMDYSVHGGVAEGTILTAFVPVEAWHRIDYNGTAVGASSTGLTAGVNYKFSVVLNGTETFYTVNGTNGQTFTTLVSAINSALPASMNALISADLNLEIESVANGVGQVIQVYDDTLFKATNGFVGFADIRVGVTTAADIFDFNFRNDYQTYASLLIGHLRDVPNETRRPARDLQDIYFNHGKKAWYYIHYITAPVPVAP